MSIINFQATNYTSIPKMQESNIESNGAMEKYPAGIDQSSNRLDDEFSIDPAKELKLLAKLDLGLIWIIMLLYLSAFLDRSNIGETASNALQDVFLSCTNILLRQCQGGWNLD